MNASRLVLLTSALLLPASAFADVTYQETTQFNGGSMMGMMKMVGAFSSQAKQALSPTTTTVMIHGNRMVRSNPHTTEIIDLDAQTITNIDHDKRTYNVMTFQQMKDAMAKAAAKAKSGGDTQADTNNGAQMTWDAHISSTGATREVNGETAKEALMTVTMVSNTSDPNAKGGMAATSEMWMVKDAPGMAEIHSFNERMAKEISAQMGASTMSALLATKPGGTQALEQLQKEASKVSGFAVLQVTRVGVTADGQPLPAPSVAPLPAQNTQAGSKGSGVAGEMGKEVAVGTATQEASNGISRLGGFGRALGGSSMGSILGHANTSKPASNNAATSAPVDAATAGVLMESQTTTSGFSTAAVDTSGFQVPSGYKEVASPLTQK